MTSNGGEWGGYMMMLVVGGWWVARGAAIISFCVSLRVRFLRGTRTEDNFLRSLSLWERGDANLGASNLLN